MNDPQPFTQQDWERLNAVHSEQAALAQRVAELEGTMTLVRVWKGEDEMKIAGLTQFHGGRLDQLEETVRSLARGALLLQSDLAALEQRLPADGVPREDDPEALRDMLEDARGDFDRVREAMRVPVEPHQTLTDRVIERAERLDEFMRVIVAATDEHGLCEGWTLGALANDAKLSIERDRVTQTALGELRYALGLSGHSTVQEMVEAVSKLRGTIDGMREAVNPPAPTPPPSIAVNINGAWLQLRDGDALSVGATWVQMLDEQSGPKLAALRLGKGVTLGERPPSGLEGKA